MLRREVLHQLEQAAAQPLSLPIRSDDGRQGRERGRRASLVGSLDCSLEDLHEVRWQPLGGAAPDQWNRVADGDSPTVVIAQRELEGRETTVERRPERAEPFALAQKVRPGGAMQRLDLSFELWSLVQRQERE